jgi:hypothetical protein
VRRHVFNTLWIFSLALGIAAATLWVRSYFVLDVLHIVSGRHVFMFESQSGRWSASEYLMPIGLRNQVEWQSERTTPTWYTRVRSLADFSIQSDMNGSPQVRWHVRSPHWAAIVACLILPAIALRRRRRRPPPGGFPVAPAPGG